MIRRIDLDIAIAIIVGFAYGGACSLLKYLFLWRPISTGKREAKSTTIYPALMISLALDVVILLLVFLFRKVLPFPFVPTIIAAALGMSAGSILPALAVTTKQSRDNQPW